MRKQSFLLQKFSIHAVWHLPPRRLASAAPSAGICRPVGWHSPPGGPAFGSRWARIWLPVSPQKPPGGPAEAAQDELTVTDWCGDGPERMVRATGEGIETAHETAKHAIQMMAAEKSPPIGC